MELTKNQVGILEDSKKKNVYIEIEIRKCIKDKMDVHLKNNLNFVDTRLRADIILSNNVDMSKQKLNEALELYEILIENEDVQWRKILPLERKILDINEID
ncbi:MAG: hypothetical protein ACRC41_13695 [Sarcina sp.]